MPQSLEELQEELKAVKESLLRIREKENQRLSLQYERAKGLLGKALLQTKDLENAFENTQEKIELSRLMNELVLANNPSTDKLGFNYQELVFKNVEEILLKELPKGEANRDRFLTIVKKLFNNPLADLITQLNPVGSIVFRIIDAASNFFETKILKKGLGKFLVSAKEVIAQERIEHFYQEMEKYISFYGKLADITYRFTNQLDGIKAKNTSLVLLMDNFHQRFLELMGIEQGPNTEGIIAQFNTLFELGPAQDGLIPFEEVLDKPEVIAAIEFAQTLPEYKQQINLLIHEFSEALSSMIDNYIQTLVEAQQWNETEIDKASLEKLIIWLRAYKEKNFTQTHHPKGFESQGRSVLRKENMPSLP